MIAETSRRVTRNKTRVWFRCDACRMSGSLSAGHDVVDDAMAATVTAHDRHCRATDANATQGPDLRP